jgi:hypothetical protein
MLHVCFLKIRSNCTIHFNNRCHVIVTDPNLFKKLQEPTDEENDMLDLAFGLTETYLKSELLMT